jgi:hypothetical protein
LDLDDGSAWFGVNNEEVGGVSDYWVMFSIGGLDYSEAEYVDNRHPFTIWGVVKPLWNDNIVAVKIAMYESDPTNHKDERMDISPDAASDLSFQLRPVNGSLAVNPRGLDSLTVIPNGRIFKSSGSGDLAVRVRVSESIMNAW